MKSDLRKVKNDLRKYEFSFYICPQIGQKTKRLRMYPLSIFHFSFSIFHLKGFRSTMDSMEVSGASDVGSIPTGTTKTQNSIVSVSTDDAIFIPNRISACYTEEVSLT